MMGYVVYQQPSHQHRRDSHKQKKDYKKTIKNATKVALGTVGVVAALTITVFLCLSLYTSIVAITWPTIVSLFTAAPILSLGNILILVLEGCIAGLLIGLIIRAFKFKSKFGKDYLSELFTFKIFYTDITFFSTMILSLLVSAFVGLLGGAAGTIGLFNFFSSNSQNIVNDVINSVVPMVSVIVGGGAGGIGSGSGLFGGGIFWIILILLIFMFQGIIIGSLSGLTFGILFGAIKGAVRGGSLASVVSLVSINVTGSNKGKIIWESTKKGSLQGALVGGIIGLIQGIITVVAFYKNRS